jgi:hypothetical protein
MRCYCSFLLFGNNTPFSFFLFFTVYPGKLLVYLLFRKCGLPVVHRLSYEVNVRVLDFIVEVIKVEFEHDFIEIFVVEMIPEFV